MGRLQGKRALVTGAAQGIGRPTAAQFVGEGAEVLYFASDDSGYTTGCLLAVDGGWTMA